MNIKIFFLIAIIFIFSVGCGQTHNHDEFKFSGTLELTEHSLGAHASGRLASLFVDEGQSVKKGQLLATLDRFEQVKKDYDRAAVLFKEGGVTAQDLEYAQLALEDQEIISPVDGVVLVKVHEVGEMISAGAAVVVVGDRSSLWVRIFVPEGKINKIRMNQSAALHFDGMKETFQGYVSFIASEAEFTPRNVQTAEERITQTFAVKIILDHPPEFLRPGVAADITLEMNDSD